MIWFTADTHFNHFNSIEYCSRPFASLDEMHERLIENWNAVVKPGDIVYHLGDFALSYGKKSAPVIDSILSRLSGQKWLICGNHDRDEVTRHPAWVKVKDYHEIKVDLGGLHKQRIVMCHYAMRVWNQCHRGAWMLYGHSHGNLERRGKSIDVGVDSHEYKPISLDFVKSVLDQQSIYVVDHHEPEYLD